MVRPLGIPVKSAFLAISKTPVDQVKAAGVIRFGACDCLNALACIPWNRIEIYLNCPAVVPYIHCRNPVSSDSQKRPARSGFKIAGLNFFFFLDINRFLT